MQAGEEIPSEIAYPDRSCRDGTQGRTHSQSKALMVHSSIVLPPSTTNIAVRPPRSGGEVEPSLPIAPRSSPGAEACMPIEADLGAVSPGRAAAGDGRGGLAEGERAFLTFMYK